MTWVLLAESPPQAAERNMKLKDLDAKCRNKLQKDWRPVAKWAIGNCTYNQLGDAWTDTSEFGYEFRRIDQ